MVLVILFLSWVVDEVRLKMVLLVSVVFIVIWWVFCLMFVVMVLKVEFIWCEVVVVWFYCFWVWCRLMSVCLSFLYF